MVLAFPFLRVGSFLMAPARHGCLTCSVTRIVEESNRLDREERDAEEAFRVERTALLEAQKRLDESLARLDRVRSQKRLLFSKGSDMVRRGLASLDEVEAVEQQESLAVVGAQANGAFGLVDWGGVFLPESELSVDPDFSSGGPSFVGLPAGAPLVDPGSSGGTPEASRGS